MENNLRIHAQQKTRRQKKIVLVIIFGLLILGMIAVSAYRGVTCLTVESYPVPCRVSEGVRIMHLTDLHSREFGEENERLVELVTAQAPDLIFMTGDMLDSKDAGPEVVLALIEELSQIAPVYYSQGNHEKQWEKENGVLLEASLTEAGATVLDCAYADVTVNGQELRIGGYYGYYRVPHMIHNDPAVQAFENAFFDEFEDTHRLKLLLCHIPTAWADWNYIDKYPVDIVFSGHYHGGMIRIPFVGGLVAPYVGLFPEYTQGVFEGEQATCVLSTGLGTSMGIPRINNLPEIVVVDIVPSV